MNALPEIQEFCRLPDGEATPSQLDVHRLVAHTEEEMGWVKEFHRHLDGIMSMGTVYSKVRQVYLPLAEADLGQVYFYQDFDSSVKELAFKWGV